MKEENEWVAFKENFIFLTLFLHVVIGFFSSFMPEENVIKWLIINMSIAILAAVMNYIIWIYQKHDSKRYFSLHSFVMVIVLIVYLMSPIFKGLYPTLFFWVILIITIGFFIFLLGRRDAITKALVNPREMRFKMFLYIFIGILLIIGGLLWAYMLAFETGPFMGVALALYFIGLLLMLVLPAFLTTPERAKQLEEMEK
ncbi:hypothetical protein [Ureibacillus sinduriensis]|uniref:Uncharacterized protein n=1 Tax=Ureibacillus sinduriensis BLB-1 = JCM 15800 TaxID=1384057 RepID=A0A0A3HV30_9BACL|nr:hypothetical protein [Ureibacillus sinduriensis]KGR76451.1 hypothetical protein CD33_06160 [Ureibacillus sinduriensis BLB-1 = JCM 15800]